LRVKVIFRMTAGIVMFDSGELGLISRIRRRRVACAAIILLSEGGGAKANVAPVF
jgi:hypothetical protein